MGPITLWTYRCVDNIVRSRCTRHVRHDGPYSIRSNYAIIRRQNNQSPERCYECYHEIAAGHAQIEEEDEAVS